MPKTSQSVNKNPYAVAVGERLKLARKMAKFSNVEALLEHMPGWEDKRSRMTNYEAGIALAPPEAIVLAARATGCSECWIMFGSGPIRSTGRDQQAIRHQNLVYVVEQSKEKKCIKLLLKSFGLSPKKVSDMIDNPFIAIQDRVARRAEQFLKKPAGWMDEQHVENDPVCRSFPEDMRELMSIYSDLDASQRSFILNMVRSVRSHSN